MVVKSVCFSSGLGSDPSYVPVSCGLGQATSSLSLSLLVCTMGIFIATPWM